MKKLIIATALLAVVATPALAQRKSYSSMSDEEKVQQKVRDSVDAQYRNTVERTSKDTAAVQVDPWANMRGTAAEQPKKKN
jgi:Ni/Co efflux regulator RcnB